MSANPLDWSTVTADPRFPMLRGKKQPYNGPEFVVRAILRWLTGAQMDMAYIDPCKP